MEWCGDGEEELRRWVPLDIGWWRIAVATEWREIRRFLLAVMTRVVGREVTEVVREWGRKGRGHRRDEGVVLGMGFCMDEGDWIG